MGVEIPQGDMNTNLITDTITSVLAHLKAHNTILALSRFLSSGSPSSRSNQTAPVHTSSCTSRIFELRSTLQSLLALLICFLNLAATVWIVCPTYFLPFAKHVITYTYPVRSGSIAGPGPPLLLDCSRSSACERGKRFPVHHQKSSKLLSDSNPSLTSATLAPS